MTEQRTSRAASTFQDSNPFAGEVALQRFSGAGPVAPPPESASPLHQTDPPANGHQDTESEPPPGGCSMNCFNCCFPAEEVETEWREVPLRFASSVAPADGQLGSTNNSIKTSKYTLLSWIPKGTFEQFRRLANVYFLGISLLMIIGTYSTLFENSIQYYTTLGPLILIIGFTLVKEGVEDKKRHDEDHKVNNRLAEVLCPEGTLRGGASGGNSPTIEVPWRCLQPGMVVVVRDRCEFPADIVCLASAADEGKCYVETANIDGETNLKLRRCAATNDAGTGPRWQDGAALLAEAQNQRSIPKLSFEPPNPSIHTFSGAAEVPLTKVRAACGASELCLRGAVLRNTKWVLGAVVYTGSDTKLVMNSREVPSKLSTIEQSVNQIIYFILLVDVIITTAMTVCRSLWNKANADKMWYLCEGNYQDSTEVFREGCNSSEDTYSDASYWFTFFILFNNLLPLSLYVTLEVVNFVQAFYVDQDIEMYDEASDTPALARTSNQNGDLGQIEYIFSDKTGTLTCNEMKFRRCSVGGAIYGNVVPGQADDEGSSNSGGAIGGGAVPKAPDAVSPLAPSSAEPLSPLQVPLDPKPRDDDDDDGVGAATVGGGGPLPGLPLNSLKQLAVPPNSRTGGGSRRAPAAAAAAAATRSPLDEEEEAATCQKLAELLATCHNVVVEVDDQTGAASYQAESPDEEALVDGGKQLGYTFLGGDAVTLHVGVGSPQAGSDGSSSSSSSGGGGTMEATRTYRLLATIPFDSARKRMSVLVQTPEGHYRLYCKGADNVMFDRASDYSLCGGRVLLEEHLEAFSNEGLRTLVLAYQDVAADVAEDWATKWNHALTLPDRADACEALAAEVEADLKVLGATAIEDRLQDGVPETIADLKEAGIKVWVLTGDKMTTAINIGFSCRLLTTQMELITLDKEGPGEDRAPVAHRLKACYDKYMTLTTHSAILERFRAKAQCFRASFCCCFGWCASNQISASSGGGSRPSGSSNNSGVTLAELETDQLALIVDGPSLTELLANEQSRHMLLQLGCFCKAVIACRVSPAQKQLIVKMVKDGLPNKPITLSIGDGANDVPMIQEAQIGVGISGKEGRQAVNSSDFAIAQFRFLKRLLLVHGRYNYRRTSKVILYSFYKNIVLVFVLVCFSFFSAFSGQSLYGAKSWCYSGYNFFLGLPPFMLGLFDRDVKPRSAMKFQKLYLVGIYNQDLNVGKVAEAFLLASWDALILFFLTMLTFQESGWRSDGKLAGLNVFGNIVFAYMFFAMLAKICLMFSSWNAWSIFSIFFSLAFYFGFVYLYSAVGPEWIEGSDVGEYDFYYVPQNMFQVPTFWLVAALVPMANFLTAFTLKNVRIEWFTPRDVVVAEYERQNEHLSEAETYALYEHAERQDALKEQEAAAREGDDHDDYHHHGAGDGGASGGGGNSHDDFYAPNVKVDNSLMRRFHSKMNDNERESVGHMSKRKLRSSFVDNASAALTGRASFARTPSGGGVATSTATTATAAAAAAATPGGVQRPPAPAPPPSLAPPSFSAMPQEGAPSVYAATEDRLSDSSTNLSDSTGGIRMSRSLVSHSYDSNGLPPLTPAAQQEPPNEGSGAAVDSSDI